MLRHTKLTPDQLVGLPPDERGQHLALSPGEIVHLPFLWLKSLTFGHFSSQRRQSRLRDSTFPNGDTQPLQPAGDTSSAKIP